MICCSFVVVCMFNFRAGWPPISFMMYIYFIELHTWCLRFVIYGRAMLKFVRFALFKNMKMIDYLMLYNKSKVISHTLILTSFISINMIMTFPVVTDNFAKTINSIIIYYKIRLGRGCIYMSLIIIIFIYSYVLHRGISI